MSISIELAMIPIRLHTGRRVRERVDSQHEPQTMMSVSSGDLRGHIHSAELLQGNTCGTDVIWLNPHDEESGATSGAPMSDTEIQRFCQFT